MRSGNRKYSDLLDADRISIGIQAETKHATIDEVVDLLEGHPQIKDLDEVRHAVHERETLMSTGVGLGLALPHAKTNAVETSLAAFGIRRPGIDFESIDGVPVELIFLLVGPESARSEHIRILSWISRMMQSADVRKQLLDAGSRSEVMSIFESEGQQLVIR